jgi:hypothetical protein
LNGGYYTDVFILKIDSSGNFVWAKQLGGSGTDGGIFITTDSHNNIYTTGCFQGSADFDPGTGIYNLTSAGSYDIFISKLDSLGNFVWATSMGGTGADFGNSIALDATGNVYTTGYFQNTADFDPGSGTFNLSSFGNKDIFISKLDNNGNFVFAKSLGGTNDDQAYSVAVDDSGNVYTTGVFLWNSRLRPGNRNI